VAVGIDVGDVVGMAVGIDVGDVVGMAVGIDVGITGVLLLLLPHPVIIDTINKTIKKLII